MKIVKNINNNFAVAIDKSGNTLVIRGKGIGFGSVPRMVEKSKIERSYYDVDEKYFLAISGIPEDIITISTKIIDKARMVIDSPINSTVVFSLADHIAFAIKRHKEKLNVSLPLVYDVQHLYEKEYEIGLYGLEVIKKELKEYLPKDEAAFIALHLINAEKTQKVDKSDDSMIVDEVTRIIEKMLNVSINRDSFNYSRFASHMFYLLKRSKNKEIMVTDNSEIYETIKKKYQNIYECSQIVSNYLKNELLIELNNEEKLYLMLHINRLCAREISNN